MTKKSKSLKKDRINLMVYLGFIFIALKLIGVTVVANWSWWLVLLPFYISFAMVFGFVILVTMVSGLMLVLGGLFVGAAAIIDTIRARARIHRNRNRNRNR